MACHVLVTWDFAFSFQTGPSSVNERNLSKWSWHNEHYQVSITYYGVDLDHVTYTVFAMCINGAHTIYPCCLLSLHQCYLRPFLYAYIFKYEWILWCDTCVTDFTTMRSSVINPLMFLNDINDYSVIKFTVHQINLLSLSVPSSTSEETWIDNRSGSDERKHFSNMPGQGGIIGNGSSYVGLTF